MVWQNFIYFVYAIFCQKRQDPQASTLQALRLHLLEHLISILPDDKEAISEAEILQASSFVRLYCVLKGMGGLK